MYNLHNNADMARWAYIYRRDRDTQPAEAYFIPRRLERLDKVYRTAADDLGERLKSWHYNQPDILTPLLPAPRGELVTGALWVGLLSDYKVVLHFDGEIPSPDKVEVRTYPTAWGWFGWTVDKVLENPEITDGGRTWTYTPEPAEMDFCYSRRVKAATEMVAVFSEDKNLPVPELHIIGGSLGQWEEMTLSVRWGILGDSHSFTGHASAHVAEIVHLETDFDDKYAELKVKYSPVAKYGADSTVTFYTNEEKTEGATVLLRNIKDEPVYIPELGFFITRAECEVIPEKWIEETEVSGKVTVCEQIRRHREPESWDELFVKSRWYKCADYVPGATPPPFPVYDAPAVRLDVPDERWLAMYNGAVEQLRGHNMWGRLAYEVARVTRSMELVGLHEQAEGIYNYFLSSPGVKSDGDFSDPRGSLEWAHDMFHDMGYSHEGTHASTGRLLYSIAERYFLTKDAEWLKNHLTRLKEAADWIIREKNTYMDYIPNRDELWVKGLMPPSMLGDYALPSSDWRWYYANNAYDLMGLTRFAEALAEIGDSDAVRYMHEADAFRSDLTKAAKKDALYAPVRRASDGFYRSFIPRTVYCGGLLHYGEETNLPNYNMGISDLFTGALPLAELFSALPASDRSIVGTINAMEEAGTMSYSFKREAVEHPTADGGKESASEESGAAWGDPVEENDRWFWNNYVDLPKASHNAGVYLSLDDIPNFLHFFMGNAVTMVGSNGKLWEHTHPNVYEVCENPDNGTAGWFIDCYRNMLLIEDVGALWLMKGTPRAWTKDGCVVRVEDAPTYFGNLSYTTESHLDSGYITEKVVLPADEKLTKVFLRFRLPEGYRIVSVSVNGTEAPMRDEFTAVYGIGDARELDVRVSTEKI